MLLNTCVPLVVIACLALPVAVACRMSYSTPTTRPAALLQITCTRSSSPARTCSKTCETPTAMAHAHDLSQSSEITLPIELLAKSEAANTEMASQVLEKTTVAACNNVLLWVFLIFPNASLWALQGFTCREIGGESLIYVVCVSRDDLASCI